MARIRTIKPSFFTNDQLAEVSPLCRLLFIGLWTCADKEGRIEDRPKRIKAEVLPFDDGDVNTMLDELVANGFIERYTADGHKCIQILAFAKHQRPHPKEPESCLPSREKKRRAVNKNGEPWKETAGCALREGDLGRRSRKGKEGDFCSEPAPPPSEPTVPPSSPELEFPIVGKGIRVWTLTVGKLAEYAETFPGIDLAGELRKARQWCLDNPAKRKTAKGMPAFLTRWLGNAQDGASRERGPPARASPPDLDTQIKDLVSRQYGGKEELSTHASE